jgi:hypothetical protein
MRRIFWGVLACLTLLLGSCKKDLTDSTSQLSKFPQNPAVILKINHLERFREALEDNSVLQKSESLNLYDKVEDKLGGLNYLKPDAGALLAFYELGRNDFDFLLLTPYRPDIFDTNKINETTVETLTYEQTVIKKYQFDDHILFSLLKENEILISSSQVLLENAILESQPSIVEPELAKLYNVADIKKSGTLFIHLKRSAGMLKEQVDAARIPEVRKFAEWISLDVDLNNSGIEFNGVTMVNDSTLQFMSLFLNTPPLTDRLSALAPTTTQSLLNFGFNDYQLFAQNQKRYLDLQEINQDTLLNTIEEVGFLNLNEGEAMVLHSLSPNDIMTYFQINSKGSTRYQNLDILEITETEFLTKGLAPLLDRFEPKYCAQLDNSIVFGNSIKPVQAVIRSWKEDDHFQQTALYQSVMQNMAEESSILYIANSRGIESALSDHFAPELFREIKKENYQDYGFAFQLIAEDDFFHTTARVVRKGEVRSNAEVNPIFSVLLDDDVATQPQYVRNHYTQQWEIIVQDKRNNLYLISTDGKVLWKRKLKSQIQGKISQVDLFKNGKLQLAFCTEDQFLVYDRNGRPVSSFEKSYSGGNLNGLAVFDYDQSRDYRFVVTQGKKAFMYNRKGQVVNGFKYTETQADVLFPPQHFRIAKKDFLVFQLADGSLKIQHRDGRDRLPLSGKIDFSNNPAFLYKDKISVTDKKGVLHQVDANGRVTTTSFQQGPDHGFYTTSKTLALLDQNTLNIKGKKVRLNNGVYTSPTIFYLGDVLYISVTDIQNSKVFLFDSNAELFGGFPVTGNSTVDLLDMNGDRKLEMVTRDAANALTVYQLN